MAAPSVNNDDTKRRTRVVRLDKAYIDLLLGNKPLGPFPRIPDEVLDRKHPLRDLLDSVAAGAQKYLDFCEGIRQQYLAKGYAEIVEEEDSDDEKEYMEYMAAQKAKLSV